MLTEIHPKLPMRDRSQTHDFYVNKLGFRIFGGDYDDYLMLQRESVQIHFFLFKELDPKTNYGQVYIRTNNIDAIYKELLASKVEIHPNGYLQKKPWGLREFALLDPDNNLLTFGQGI